MDVRLPTTGRDWALVGRTVKLVLSIPGYAGLAVLTALLGLSTFVLSRNLSVLTQVVLFGDLPVGDRVRVLLELYPVVGSAYTPAQTIVLLVTAATIGVNLAVAGYHVREHRMSVSQGSGSLGGIVLGTLGAGCAACGSAVLAGLLSTIGASGLLLALPLDGLEFSLIAMVVLVLSLYWLADGLRGSRINGCPVDLPANDD